MCEKVSYPSQREANQALNRAKNDRVYKDGRRVKSFHVKKGHKDKLPVRAYRCPDCQQWHLTSKIEKRSRNETRRRNFKQQPPTYEPEY